jgi:hypothetical protein
MLKEDEFSVLELIKNFCKKDYKLISVDTINSLLEEMQTEEETQVVIKRLDEKGYIDVKYYGEEEFLVKPLPIAYTVIKQDQKQLSVNDFLQPTFNKKDKTEFLLICFSGSAIGGIIAFLLGVLSC